MSDSVTIGAEELQGLRDRLTSLAKNGAHLKLINSVLTRLSSVSGLSNIVDKILAILMETVGGSNLIVYYTVEGRWYSQDIFGTKENMEEPADENVLLCVQTGAFVGTQPVTEISSYGSTSQSTWVFPLSVHQNVIGAVVMEGVQLADISIQNELQPFFVYAALMLGNEISNYKVLEIAHYELMEAHQELECEIEARREAEEQYRVLFEQSPDGVVLLDPVSKKPVRFNAAAHKQLGYTHEEFAVLSLLEIDAIESLAEIEQRTRILLEHGTATFDTVHRTKNGQLRDVQVSAKSIFLERTPYILSIYRDITDSKKMEGELLKSQKLESLGVLAGGIAHDFNNLLTAIVGNISLAANCLEPDSRPAALLAASEKACLRARDLTQQLLTFAKGGAPVKQHSSIAAVVRESADFALRGSESRCEFHIPDDLRSAEIDKGQIGQVIHNLIINADQAMPGGGTVRVSCANVPHVPGDPVDDYWVRIDVQDSGVGIQPEYLQKIFDPYFTTKQKGSGLGLASSFSIIRNHHGRIEVESTPGVGTVFHVFLPAVAASAEQPLKEHVAASSRHFRIMIMDDERIVFDVVAEMLHLLGHDVVKTANGTDALKAYRKALAEGRRFDLVILDLTIPGGMGGREAAKLLLQIDPDVKAVVSSGYASDSTVAEYKSSGFVGVLSKPFTLSDIEKLLADL